MSADAPHLTEHPSLHKLVLNPDQAQCRAQSEPACCSPQSGPLSFVRSLRSNLIG